MWCFIIDAIWQINGFQIVRMLPLTYQRRTNMAFWCLRQVINVILNDTLNLFNMRGKNVSGARDQESTNHSARCNVNIPGIWLQVITMLTGKTSWLSISSYSILSFFTWRDGTFAIQHSQVCKWEDHPCKPISLACGAHLIFKQVCSKFEMPINCKQERQCCYSMYSILTSNVILTFYFYSLTSADLTTITVEVPAMVKITVYIRTCIIFPLEFKWASLLQ